MNEGHELVTITPEVRHDTCAKIVTGLCTQTGEIAVMMTEVRTLKAGQEEIKTSMTDFKKDFQDFKGDAAEVHSDLAKTLAAIKEALKAEQEAKKGQAENQKLLLDQIKDISADVKNIDRDVKKIDHNVTVMQGELKSMDKDVKEHDHRISGLERVSFWVYSAVGALVLMVIVVSNWGSIREVIDKITQTPIKEPASVNYFIEDNKIYYLKDINNDGKEEKVLYTPTDPNKK